jgi:hypothetical protein
MAAENAKLRLTSPKASGETAHELDTATAYSAGTLLSLKNNGTEKFGVAHDGAARGKLLDKGGAVHNVMAYGAVGDGSTDDTTAIAAACAAAVASDGEVLVAAPCAVTGVTLPAGARLRFSGAGRLVGTDTSTLLTAGGDNITLHDPVFDLGGASTRAFYATGRSGLKVLGTTLVRNPLQTAGVIDSFQGGLIFDQCDDWVVEDVVVEGLTQNAPSVGRLRAIGATTCNNFEVRSITAHGVDFPCVIYDCNNWKVGSIVAYDVTDNGAYIQNDSLNGAIDSVTIHGCTEGVVFRCNSSDANIHVGSLFVRDSSVRGMSLRTGGGYHIGTATLVDSQFAQSGAYLVTATPPGVGALHRLTIGTLRVFASSSFTSLRPVILEQNVGVSIGTLEIYAHSPNGGEAARFIDCDRLVIGHLVIVGTGAAVTVGFRFWDGDAPVTDPTLVVGMLTTVNVTTPYIVNVAGKTNVVVNQPLVRYKSLTIQDDDVATLQFRSLDTSRAAGEAVARLEMYNSDSSSAGAKFTLELQAAGGTGGAGQTVIKNDQGAVVARIPTNQGMAVKLPTASTGLESGMIWNNAGTVTIVP